MDTYKKVVIEKDYRVNLVMKRDGDKLLSSWQISAFIENLSRSYYKNELLNTIESYINRGTSLENIFIIDESFKLNNLYRNLDTLNLRNEKDAKQLYHLGKPIGMIPNEKLIKTNLLFDIFRKTNETLWRYRIKGLNKNYLSSLINFAMDDKATMKEIKEKVINLAIENYNQFLQEETKNNQYNAKIDRKSLVNYIEKNILYIMNSYQKIESNFVNIAIVKEDIFGNDNKNIASISADLLGYFNKFKVTFDNLMRPVVGIYSPEDNSMEIVCKDFIDKTLYTEKNKRFLDIKNISRNSPLTVAVLLGIGGLTFLSRHITVVMDERLLQKKQVESHVPINEEKEIENLINEIKQVIEGRESTHVTEVAHDIMDSLRKDNEAKFIETAKDYGFLNEHAVLKVKEEV